MKRGRKSIGRRKSDTAVRKVDPQIKKLLLNRNSLGALSNTSTKAWQVAVVKPQRREPPAPAPAPSAPAPSGHAASSPAATPTSNRRQNKRNRSLLETSATPPTAKRRKINDVEKVDPPATLDKIKQTALLRLGKSPLGRTSNKKFSPSKGSLARKSLPNTSIETAPSADTNIRSTPVKETAVRSPRSVIKSTPSRGKPVPAAKVTQSPLSPPSRAAPAKEVRKVTETPDVSSPKTSRKASSAKSVAKVLARRSLGRSSVKVTPVAVTASKKTPASLYAAKSASVAKSARQNVIAEEDTPKKSSRRKLDIAVPEGKALKSPKSSVRIASVKKGVSKLSLPKKIQTVAPRKLLPLSAKAFYKKESPVKVKPKKVLTPRVSREVSNLKAKDLQKGKVAPQLNSSKVGRSPSKVASPANVVNVTQKKTPKTVASGSARKSAKTPKILLPKVLSPVKSPKSPAKLSPVKGSPAKAIKPLKPTPKTAKKNSPLKSRIPKKLPIITPKTKTITPKRLSKITSPPVQLSPVKSSPEKIARSPKSTPKSNREISGSAKKSFTPKATAVSRRSLKDGSPAKSAETPAPVSPLKSSPAKATKPLKLTPKSAKRNTPLKVGSAIKSPITPKSETVSRGSSKHVSPSKSAKTPPSQLSPTKASPKKTTQSPKSTPKSNKKISPLKSVSARKSNTPKSAKTSVRSLKVLSLAKIVKTPVRSSSVKVSPQKDSQSPKSTQKLKRNSSPIKSVSGRKSTVSPKHAATSRRSLKDVSPAKIATTPVRLSPVKGSPTKAIKPLKLTPKSAKRNSPLKPGSARKSITLKSAESSRRSSKGLSPAKSAKTPVKLSPLKTSPKKKTPKSTPKSSRNSSLVKSTSARKSTTPKSAATPRRSLKDASPAKSAKSPVKATPQKMVQSLKVTPKSNPRNSPLKTISNRRSILRVAIGSASIKQSPNKIAGNLKKVSPQKPTPKRVSALIGAALKLLSPQQASPVKSSPARNVKSPSSSSKGNSRVSLSSSSRKNSPRNQKSPRGTPQVVHEDITLVTPDDRPMPLKGRPTFTPKRPSPVSRRTPGFKSSLKRESIRLSPGQAMSTPIRGTPVLSTPEKLSASPATPGQTNSPGQSFLKSVSRKLSKSIDRTSSKSVTFMSTSLDMSVDITDISTLSSIGVNDSSLLRSSRSLPSPSPSSKNKKKGGSFVIRSLKNVTPKSQRKSAQKRKSSLKSGNRSGNKKSLSIKGTPQIIENISPIVSPKPRSPRTPDSAGNTNDSNIVTTPNLSILFETEASTPKDKRKSCAQNKNKQSKASSGGSPTLKLVRLSGSLGSRQARTEPAKKPSPKQKAALRRAQRSLNNSMQTTRRNQNSTDQESNSSDMTDINASRPNNEIVITPKSIVKLQPELLKEKHSTAKKSVSRKAMIDHLTQSPEIVKELFRSPVKRKLSQSIRLYNSSIAFDDAQDESIVSAVRDASFKLNSRASPRQSLSKVPSTPLNRRSSDRKSATVSLSSKSKNIKKQKSPKNDLTNVAGVKRLLKTPKAVKSPKNDLTNVAGVKKLFNSPKVQNSPKNDLTNVAGVKRLLKTPRAVKSPKNDLTNVAGVKKLLTTPRVQKSPKNDLTQVAGVKRLLKTPRAVKSPKNDLTRVSGVKKLLATPRPAAKSPKNSLINVAGVKRLLATPKPAKSPKNDLTNVAGVKALLKTPRVAKSPLNDLSNVHGVKSLFKTPGKSNNSPKNDLSDVSAVKTLFPSPKGKQKSPNNAAAKRALQFPSGVQKFSPRASNRNTPDVSVLKISPVKSSAKKVNLSKSSPKRNSGTPEFSSPSYSRVQKEFTEASTLVLNDSSVTMRRSRRQVTIDRTSFSMEVSKVQLSSRKNKNASILGQSTPVQSRVAPNSSVLNIKQLSPILSVPLLPASPPSGPGARGGKKPAAKDAVAKPSAATRGKRSAPTDGSPPRKRGRGRQAAAAVVLSDSKIQESMEKKKKVTFASDVLEGLDDKPVVRTRATRQGRSAEISTPASVAESPEPRKKATRGSKAKPEAPKAKPKAEPKASKAKPKAEAKVKAEAEPKASKAKPKAEPKATKAKSKAEPKVTKAKPKAEPKASRTTRGTKAEPEAPKAELKASKAKPKAEPKSPKADPKSPKAKPKAEPKSPKASTRGKKRAAADTSPAPTKTKAKASPKSKPAPKAKAAASKKKPASPRVVRSTRQRK